jgi:hypothetical protein
MKHDPERLLFRRQFILGPRFVENFTSWKRIKVGTQVCLTVHPDLSTCQIRSQNKAITLLGYILDPNDPEAYDADIINHLLGNLCACDNSNDFFKYTYHVGGRWVLIVEDGDEVMLFHDAMGLRQVFYTDAVVCGAVWCASQPGIIAETLGLQMDEEAVTDYINSDVYKKWEEYLWPADSTPYHEIKHLLPNHSLNLSTGVAQRYYPDGDLEVLSLEEGIKHISRVLIGFMKSASNRFDLALAMSAGWDTRLILAASREISDRLWFFTLLHHPDAPDTTVPLKLLKKLGLRHHQVKYPQQMEDEFERLYKRNVTTAHERWGRMGQGLYNMYPENRVCVKGNAAEITRVRFRLPPGGQVTAKTLARFTSFQYAKEMVQNSFVLKHWQKWLSGTGRLYNVHILDLFYWEHWGGNFAAMTQAEFDILQDAFTPYNCRQLLMTMLSVDEKHRNHEEPVLYRKLILNLWPEVLSEPVNPPYSPPVGQRIKNQMKQAILHCIHWVSSYQQ